MELSEQQKRIIEAAINAEWNNPRETVMEAARAAASAVLAASGLVRIEDELRKARDIGAKKSPRLVVCAVIFRDGKVLLERRAPKGTDGLDHKWDLPGGKVEINETPEEAIIREIAEELFVSIRSTRMIPYLLTSKWTYADGEERHWILNAYVCEIIGGEPVCGTDLQWFDIRNLPLDILEADRNLVTVAWQSGSRLAAQPAQEQSGEGVRVYVDENETLALVRKHIFGDATLDGVIDFIMDYEGCRAITAPTPSEPQERVCGKCGSDMCCGVIGRECEFAPAPEPAERVTVDLERVAQLIAHRVCIGTEHDAANGKLHGYCVVCGVPWPCDYAGPLPAEQHIRAEMPSADRQLLIEAVLAKSPFEQNNSLTRRTLATKIVAALEGK